MKYNKIIVDEGVSDEKYIRLKIFLTSKGYGELDVVFIMNEHRGMPDNQILHHLLNGNTIFLTTDRPFHNKVLSQNYKSYYVGNDNFTGKKLKGIVVKDNYALNKDDLDIKDDYHLPKTPIREFLLPLSETTLKKLRTKRRRIRGHFGGGGHLAQVTITTSWHSCNSSTIFGIRFKISSNMNGVKALDASESYIREKISPEHCGIVALSYALILSVQLMLHHVRTQLFYDSPKIEDPMLYLEKEQMNRHEKLFAELYSVFPNIEFTPSEKGFFIERVRKKLVDLSRNKSNEIVSGNIDDIINKIENYNPECEQNDQEAC